MILRNDPNFPSGLDIKPLAVADSEGDTRFNSSAQEGAIQRYGIAGRVWEASHAMLAYLDPGSTLEFDPSPCTRSCGPAASLPRTPHAVTAIELGSGNGFAAAHIARWLRTDVDLLIATDLPAVCPLLDTNLHAYGGAVRVRPLPWGSRAHADAILHELEGGSVPGPGSPGSPAPPRCLTHVLCSDLVYFPELLAPLLRSLLHLTSPPPQASLGQEAHGARRACPWQPPAVVVAYKVRSLTKEMPFWSAFGLWFEFVPVLAADGDSNSGPDAEARSASQARAQQQWRRFSPGGGGLQVDGGDADDETFVLVAARRPESFSWTVPGDDRALLSGVGAYGARSSRADDQFERLLFMRVEL